MFNFHVIIQERVPPKTFITQRALDHIFLLMIVGAMDLQTLPSREISVTVDTVEVFLGFLWDWIYWIFFRLTVFDELFLDGGFWGIFDLLDNTTVIIVLQVILLEICDEIVDGQRVFLDFRAFVLDFNFLVNEIFLVLVGWVPWICFLVFLEIQVDRETILGQKSLVFQESLEIFVFIDFPRKIPINKPVESA
jgi:hypothetical protein